MSFLINPFLPSTFPHYHLLAQLLGISQFFFTHKVWGGGITRRAGSPTVHHPAFSLSTNQPPGEKVHGLTASSSEKSQLLSFFVFVLWLAWFMSTFFVTSPHSAQWPFHSGSPFQEAQGHRRLLYYASALLIHACHSLPVWTVSFSVDRTPLPGGEFSVPGGAEYIRGRVNNLGSLQPCRLAHWLKMFLWQIYFIHMTVTFSQACVTWPSFIFLLNSNWRKMVYITFIEWLAVCIILSWMCWSLASYHPREKVRYTFNAWWWRVSPPLYRQENWVSDLLIFPPGYKIRKCQLKARSSESQFTVF